MIGKIFRFFLYVTFVLVAFASAKAAPAYSDLQVTVTCGSVAAQKVMVFIQTPPDENNGSSAALGVTTDAQGEATFIQIGAGRWDVFVGGKYVDTVEAPEGVVAATTYEYCNNRLFVPIIANQ